MRQGMKYIVYGVISLAAIGLVGQLIMNPGSFFKSILMMIGFAVIIGAIIYYFVFSKGQGQNAKYRKAVKQSKKKYGNRHSTFQPGLQMRKPNKLRDAEARAHLRVIKGKKNS